MRLGWSIRKLIHHVGELVFSPRYALREVNEFPTKVKNGIVYIVSDAPAPDTIIFKCPCGCDEIVYLNLLTDMNPSWKFRINRAGLVSIVPSVWRKVGCRSHFFITSGKVINC